MRWQHRIFVCSPGVGGAASPGVGAAAGQATGCVAVAEQSLRMEHICLGGTYCIFVSASCTPPVTPPTPTSVPASPCVVKRRVMQISVHDCIGAEIIILQS